MIKNIVLASVLAVSTLAAAGQANAGGYHHGYKAKFYGGYGYGHRHCFWMKRKFWGYYGPYYKRIRICR